MNELERLAQEAGVEIDPERIPRHIAIIMDGNGRWATAQGLPRALGHVQGYQVTRDIVRAASDIGVGALTLYTFSTENWSRGDEANKLMELYEQATRDELPMCMENNVVFRISGHIPGMPESLQDALNTNIQATAKNTGLVLNLAMNYGSRAEILGAVRESCQRVQAGEISAEEITEEYFSGLLYTAGLPDPDLLIRTANEMRVSNFLLWQIAYTEFWVTPTLWPEFTPAEMVKAISEYQGRTRKFGRVVK